MGQNMNLTTKDNFGQVVFNPEAFEAYAPTSLKLRVVMEKLYKLEHGEQDDKRTKKKKV